MALNNFLTNFNKCVSRLQEKVRYLRTRAYVAKSPETHYVVENHVISANWPPLNDHGSPMTPQRCKSLMYDLNKLEMRRMQKSRKFTMPEFNLGDLVEVKYELSRTQQTFAVFEGYCVGMSKKGLNSTFTLKNAFDGVGMSQMIPYYSPRLLNVKVIKSASNFAKDVISASTNFKPITRDYRYKFHLNVRNRFAKKSGVHKPGIRSFEIRLKNRVARLKRRYYAMRLEAGLPPYIWAGAHNIRAESKAKEVQAETSRRIQIYGMDEARSRAEKLHKRREKHKWTNYKLPGLSYLRDLETSQEKK